MYLSLFRNKLRPTAKLQEQFKEYLYTLYAKTLTVNIYTIYYFPSFHFSSSLYSLYTHTQTHTHIFPKLRVSYIHKASGFTFLIEIFIEISVASPVVVRNSWPFTWFLPMGTFCKTRTTVQYHKKILLQFSYFFPGFPIPSCPCALYVCVSQGCLLISCMAGTNQSCMLMLK